MKNIALYLTVLLILWLPAVIFANDDPPEPLKNPGPPPPGLVVPIDSGIIILLISGFLLGIYFLLTFRKKIT